MDGQTNKYVLRYNNTSYFANVYGINLLFYAKVNIKNNDFPTTDRK